MNTSAHGGRKKEKKKKKDENANNVMACIGNLASANKQTSAPARYRCSVRAQK